MGRKSNTVFWQPGKGWHYRLHGDVREQGLLSAVPDLREWVMSEKRYSNVVDMLRDITGDDALADELAADIRAKQVSFEEVEALHRRLEEINAMPFDEIQWTRNGEPMYVPPERAEAWRFIGLSNASFVEFCNEQMESLP